MGAMSQSTQQPSSSRPLIQQPDAPKERGHGVVGGCVECSEMEAKINLAVDASLKKNAELLRRLA